MYLFVPCDKKSHGTEISFPICSNRLSHPHPPVIVCIGGATRGTVSRLARTYTRPVICGKVLCVLFVSL